MVREAASNGANLILLPELFERPYFVRKSDTIIMIMPCL